MDLVNVIGKIQHKIFVAGRTQSQAFCFSCSEQVSLMSFQQATELDEASQTELIGFLESGAIHRVHNSKGHILICLNSLRQAKEQYGNGEFMSLKLARNLEMV